MAAEDYKRICQCCGKTYYKNPKREKNSGNKYCTRECAFKAHKDWNKQSIAHESTEPKATAVYFKVCATCGESFVTNLSTQIICSEECRVLYARDVAYNRNVAKKDCSPITCKSCGVVFVPEYGTKKRLFCTEKCCVSHGRRISKAVRRARVRRPDAEQVDPFYIFARDGWKCKLCGVKTPRSKRGSYDSNAPELDHIVPLSAGGAHSISNTQCACRKCNQKKSNRPMGQMLLIG